VLSKFVNSMILNWPKYQMLSLFTLVEEFAAEVFVLLEKII
jgi:hypothetical protein